MRDVFGVLSAEFLVSMISLRIVEGMYPEIAESVELLQQIVTERKIDRTCAKDPFPKKVQSFEI